MGLAPVSKEKELANKRRVDSTHTHRKKFFCSLRLYANTLSWQMFSLGCAAEIKAFNEERKAGKMSSEAVREAVRSKTKTHLAGFFLVDAHHACVCMRCCSPKQCICYPLVDCLCSQSARFDHGKVSNRI